MNPDFVVSLRAIEWGSAGAGQAGPGRTNG